MLLDTYELKNMRKFTIDTNAKKPRRCKNDELGQKLKFLGRFKNFT